jgi:integrase
MVKFIRRELGHIRLEAFADQFEAYRRNLLNTPTAFGKPRGPASVNRYTEIVCATFNHLVGLGAIDRNPITKARFPRMKEKPRDRYLSQEERLRLLSAIREHRPFILPIVQYMMSVPCRVSELTSARKLQYSPLSKTIYIPTSKNGKPIYKPIPEEMLSYFNGIPDGCEWLFYKEDGNGYHPLTYSLRKAWEYCRKKAGIPDYRIHDLRHKAVTDLYHAGNSVRLIMAVAGWSTDMLNTYYNPEGLPLAQGTVFGAVV